MDIGPAVILVLNLLHLDLPNEVEMHFTSHHLSNSSQFNEDNFGIGIRFPIKNTERFGFTAGTYNNSYDRQSFYTGITFDHDFCAGNKYVCKAGIIGGLVSGYDKHTSASAIQPIALPQLTLGFKQVFLRSRFIPKINKETSAVFSFSVGFNF